MASVCRCDDLLCLLLRGTGGRPHRTLRRLAGRSRGRIGERDREELRAVDHVGRHLSGAAVAVSEVSPSAPWPASPPRPMSPDSTPSAHRARAVRDPSVRLVSAGRTRTPVLAEYTGVARVRIEDRHSDDRQCHEQDEPLPPGEDRDEISHTGRRSVRGSVVRIIRVSKPLRRLGRRRGIPHQATLNVGVYGASRAVSPCRRRSQMHARAGLSGRRTPARSRTATGQPAVSSTQRAVWIVAHVGDDRRRFLSQYRSRACGLGRGRSREPSEESRVGELSPSSTTGARSRVGSTDDWVFREYIRMAVACLAIVSTIGLGMARA